MKPMLVRGSCALLLGLSLASPSRAQVAAPPAPLPASTAAAEGFAADRLDRLHGRLKRYVDEGQIAGAISLVARRGKIVDVHTVGLRDREKQLPMTRDTIVRIYSMSKILTSVAVLMLVEEGAIRLEDPIAVYLPSLKAPQVFTGGTAAAPQLATAARPITIRHLLTHTSGFGYGLAQGPVDDLYRAAKLFEATTADELVAKVATLPLVAQPGERFNYGVNTDLLGAIVEKVSGKSLGAFMKARLLDPLGMPDTGFDVPAAKRARLATLYQREGSGPLANVASFQTPGSKPSPVPYPDPDGRLFHSGGGGMFSTADDFARLAQMLLNGGELDGVRILGRKTVASMTANQMTHVTNPGNSHQAFGLGVSVRIDQAGGPVGGSVGEFGWNGAATTYVSIDPQEQLVSILLTQHFPYDQPGIFSVFSTMVNAAIVR
jgi:CubicO group peptidase (beta-lactamase class C family)